MINESTSMKNTFVKLIILTIFLSVNNLKINAQTPSKRILSGGIYILPSQLVFPEVLLTYETFLFKQISLSFSAGYKIPTGSKTTLKPFGSGLFAVYEYQYMFNEYSHGVYFSTAPSLYLDNNRTFYVSTEPFYRYYWFNDKKLLFDNEETERYNSVRSEKNHVIGLKLLFGLNTSVRISEKKAITFKIYSGLSARYKIYNYKNINNVSEDGTVYPFYQETGAKFYPVGIQLGVKIGMSNWVETLW